MKGFDKHLDEHLTGIFVAYMIVRPADKRS
jgi:hypothetical protein